MDWHTVLSDSYVPPVLFFREKQLGDLETRWTNLYCEGERSTGKTVTALYYKRKVNDKDHKVIYVQCKRAMNLQFLKAMLSDGIQLNWYEKQYPITTLFEKVEEPKLTIILDDVQKISYFKSFNNLLHDLYENGLAYGKDLRLVLIGTTNYFRFLEVLRDDVKSRLRLECLHYPKYNAKEIRRILKQRLDLAGLSYEDGAINFIAAKLIRLASEIREGLKILREVCEAVCENGVQKEPITLDLVQRTWEPHKISYWKEHIRGLYWHEKAVLFSATKIALEKMRKKQVLDCGSIEVTTIEINKQYRKFCYQCGEEPLYYQRVSYIIKKLCDQDFLLKTSVVSLGRKGRTTKYLYALNPETIYKVFNELENWQ